MNKNFVVADLGGKILRKGSCSPQFLFLQQQLGEQVVEGVGDPGAHYILDGAITPRPVMPVTVSGPVAVDEDWEITGIPAGALVTYPDGAVVVDDGFIQWSSAVPGEFKFTVELWPYLPKVVYASVS